MSNDNTGQEFNQPKKRARGRAFGFTLRGEKRIREAGEAQEFFAHTDTQMVNEAFRLYAESAKEAKAAG